MGAVAALTYANGLSETRQYDGQGRVTEIAVPGALTLSYGYDPAGNIRSQSGGSHANTY